jgi:hypothetical protein
MKETNKERLHADLIKYCDQIGILPEERPRLVLDRKEYYVLKGSRWAHGYGECNWQLRTIFVDAGVRRYSYRTYRKPKAGYLSTPNDGKTGYFYKLRSYGSIEYKKVKATYTTKLHCLIHELVHYRFGYMSHNKRFEQRIKEILHGRTFPRKHVDLEGKLSEV